MTTELTTEPTTERLPPVCLVVLAWNHWAVTRRCLRSLLATDLSGAEVLVVDNGSTDETPRALAEFAGIRVMRLPENRGFVGGNNAGIEAVSPACDIVLLNNDLEFPRPDWLQRLRAAANAATDIGVAGCRLVRPDGELLHAGTYILPDTVWGQQIGSQEVDLGQFSGGDRSVDGVVFACAYLKRSLIEAIGLLSTDYESYFEDTDYCLRAGQAGFRVVMCGAVTLLHQEHGSTADAPEVFERIFQASRATFRRKWLGHLERRYRHELLWQSILNFPTGYAASSRELLRHLDDAGVRVAYRYVYGPGTGFPVPEDPDTRDYRLNVIAQRSVPRRPPVSVVYGQGDAFQKSRGRYRIGYTMLEVDGFPAEWVRQANELDEVWVPSEFNRQGFLDSGLRTPIYRLPLGVEPAYFHPGIRAVPNPHGEFVFLSSFEWGERKDPWLLLQTFNETFSSSEPVRLVCKVINRDPSVSVQDEVRRLGLRESGGRISYLLNVEFPHYQLGCLYRSADCYVSASRGEGWDMPLMEALACGVPSIATDWGGHRDFFHADIGYPLAVRRLVPAVARCPYYTGFRWAEPDRDHLRLLLREVYENRERAAALGQAAAREMAARWTWRHSSAKIVDRLDQIAGVSRRTSDEVAAIP